MDFTPNPAFDAGNAVTFPRHAASVLNSAGGTMPRQRPLSASMSSTTRPLSQFDSADASNTINTGAGDQQPQMPARRGSTSSLNSLAQSAGLQQPLKSFSKKHAAQLKALQAHCSDDAAVAELMRDYFKRRAELELSAAAEMDKMTRAFLAKSVALGLASGAQLTAASAGLNNNASTLPVAAFAAAAATTAHTAQKLRRSTVTGRPASLIVNSAGNTVPPEQQQQPPLASVAGGASKMSLSPSTANITAPTVTEVAAGGGMSMALTRAVHQSFHTLLVESQVAIRARTQAYEQQCAQLTDHMKEWGQLKASRVKKVCDNASKIQAELFAEYAELDKTKKAYDEAYADSQKALTAYTTIVSKPANARTTSMLGRLTGGGDGNTSKKEENTDRTRRKYADAVHRANLLRNDYLLQLEITNALHSTYYSTVLPRLMLDADGDFYGQFSQALNRYADWETSAAKAVQQGLHVLGMQTALISREGENAAFLLANSAAYTAVPAEFEPIPAAGDDNPLPFAQDSDESQTRAALQDKLDQLVIAQSNLQQAVVKKEKEVAGLQSLRAAYERTPKFGDGDSAADASLVASYDLAVLQFTRAKIDAQVNALRSAGLTVHENLSNHRVGNNGQAHAPAGAPNAGRSRRMSIIGTIVGVVSSGSPAPTSNSNGNSAQLPTSPTFEITSVKRASAALAATVAAPTTAAAAVNNAPSTRKYEAKVMYQYVATTGSELDLTANDTVFVVEELTARSDGWVRCERTDGKRGLCPLNYIEVTQELPTAAPVAVTVTSTPAAPPAVPSGGKHWVEVVYEYAAVVDGELTIEPGEVVEVLNTDTGSEEWWEGRVRGKTGQFPTAYVRPYNPGEKAAAAAAHSVHSMGRLDTAATSADAASTVSGGSAQVQQQSLNTSMNGGGGRRRGSVTGTRVKVIKAYTPRASNEIELTAGEEVITLSEEAQHGSNADSGVMWEGRNMATGKSGRFPASCVERMG